MPRPSLRTASLHRTLGAVFLGAALTAQTPSWSPDWATAGLGGTVFALGEYQSELYAGGHWFEAKGGVIRSLARFDGQDWRPVGPGLDLVNYSFPPRNIRVLAMTVFQGELVFAGTFDRVGSQPVNYIARWDGTTVRPLGGGLTLTFDEAEVRGLAVYNNELYAAGQFDNAGGVAVNGIARWDGTTWRAVGSGVRDSIANTVGYPRCLHVHGGQLVCGGAFDRAGGLVANNVAAWNGASWSAMGAGSFAPVYALTTYGTQLVAQGQFQLGANVAMVASWNGATWSALGSNGPTAPGVSLCAIGTELWADEGASLSRFDGVSWNRPSVIVSGIFSGVEGTAIRALQAHGGELIIGGEFTRAGLIANAPTAASSNIVAYDRGAAFRTLGTGLGVSGKISRMRPWRSGWAAMGMFNEAGATPTSGLAFFDGDRWSRLGTFTAGLYGLGLMDIAVFNGDLVIVGDFVAIDGITFPGIARHDGTTWRSFGSVRRSLLATHGSDLYASGGSTIDKWNGTGWTTVANTGSLVSMLHSHRDGRLYIGTDDAFNHRIWSWNGTVLAQIGTANDFLATMGSWGQDLVVGGRFTSVGGVASPLLARWSGGAWRAMPGAVSGYSAYAVAELDGNLYAGVSGDPRGYLLELAAGSSSWQALGAGIGSVPTMLFADRAVGSVIGSGELYSAASLPSHCIAEWRTRPVWKNRLHGTAAVGDVPPQLIGRGSAQIGSTLSWTVEGPPNLPVVFGAGTARIDAPLFGALLVPSPDVMLFLATDGNGTATLQLQVPPTAPAGIDVWSQAWLVDPRGPQGFTASNALECRTSL